MVSEMEADRAATVMALKHFMRKMILPVLQSQEETLPDHHQQVMGWLRAFPEDCPAGIELDALLSHPQNHLGRMVRDLFRDKKSAAQTLQDPLKAIVQHPEHYTLYRDDLLCAGFQHQQWTLMLDIVRQHYPGTPLSVAEIGAGTGGLTLQVLRDLCQAAPGLEHYVATDIIPGCGPPLLKAANNPKLSFEVWDINREAPKALQGPFHLIAASNALHTCRDISVALRNVHACLPEGGFLLMYEGTSTGPACVWGLDARVWDFADRRDYAAWMSLATWQARLAAAGFKIVASHKCPRDTAALLLCQKVSTDGPILLAPLTHDTNAVCEKAGQADILGFSCRMPESASPAHFWDNLVAGRDMVTEDSSRWPAGIAGTPKRFGKVPDLAAFDAAFFKVHGRLAQKLDPQIRKLLECTWEAWLDAGIDVAKLRGGPVGVYVGCCGSDVGHVFTTNDIGAHDGYENLGTSMSMFAARISWTWDFKGPCKSVDTACSSSLVALHDAVTDLEAGRCEYAVVGGSSAIVIPHVTMGFHKLQMLSPDGACKAFDASANGYARADGMAVMVLCRAGLSREAVSWTLRSPLATILATGTMQDGHTPEGINFPSGAAQRDLAGQVCREAGIDARTIRYVEAHGTGTQAGDGQELAALDAAYGLGAQRSAADPLLVGSVKSNMGHCEGASGLAGLSKVLLAFEHGYVPPNLHFKSPTAKSQGLAEGRLKVVTEPESLSPGDVVALSSFGFGGTNVHVVLRGAGPPAAPPLQAAGRHAAALPEAALPLASRTSEGLQRLAELLLRQPPEGVARLAPALARLCSTALADPYTFRARGLLEGDSLRHAIARGRDVWFALSGNGSQWAGMAQDLLEASPTFASTVRRAAAAVAPLGVDLMAAFCNPNGWANGLEAAVGLTAVQIGLSDMLAQEHSLVPAGFLGHSAGEIACAYLDGTLTLEQAVLVAHARARAAARCPPGVMASVGLSKNEALARLKAANAPTSVVACDNSPMNVTISGRAEELDPVFEALDKEGIFVRKLATNNVAFHCPLLDGCLDALRADLERIIPDPKQSTGRWLSTSQATREPFMSDAAYQVNSFRNQVLFRTAAASISDGAIVLEVGPHAVLRALLRQNKPELPYVASMRKGDPAAVTVGAAIQELWLAGAPLMWPAPTPGSSPEYLPREVREALVAWEYCDEFPLPIASGRKGEAKDVSGGAYTKTFDLGGEHAFLADHKVDGQILIPATAYLVCAWEALATQRGCAASELAVEFQDFSIHQAVSVQPRASVTLSVTLSATDSFQVLSNGDMIAEGTIRAAPPALEADAAAAEEPSVAHGGDAGDADMYITPASFYANLARNRIEYGPAFCTLEEMHAAGDAALLRWDGCHIRFLDGLLQVVGFSVLASADRALRLPVHIRSLSIVQPGTQRATGTLVPVEVSNACEYCSSPIATVQGVHLASAPMRPASYSIVRSAHEWVPYGERVTGDEHIPAYLAQVDSTARACLSAAAAHNGALPPSLQQVADVLGAAATGRPAAAQLPEDEGERNPQEALCSVLDELFKDEAACKTTLQDPRAALQGAEGYKAMRAEDAFLGGFSGDELATLLDVVGENSCSVGRMSACLVAPQRDAPFAAKVRKTMTACSYVDVVSFMAVAGKQEGQDGAETAGLQLWDINEEAPAELLGSQSLIAGSDIAPICSEVAPALAHLAAALTEGGFLLLREFTGPHALLLQALMDGSSPPRRTSDHRDFGPYLTLASWRAALEAAGLRMVSVLRQPGDGQALMLYRKVPVMAGDPVFIPGPPETAQAMQDWLQEYLPQLTGEAQDAAEEPGRHAYLVGSCKTSAGLVGMMAGLKWEVGNGSLRCLYDMSCAGRGGGLSAEAMLGASGGLCMVQGVFKDGVMGCVHSRPISGGRKVAASAAARQGARLELGQVGQLSTLRWVAEPAAGAADGVPVDVTFAAVNYKDIMLATGKLQREADANSGALGFEWAGRVAATGERVMGTGLRTFATKIHSAPERYWAIPAAWSLAESATVPVAYSTAYYALVMRGRLEASHRVLIHAGAGAVGMAAIRICLHRGCEVFTTCGSRAKREALLGMFPELQEDHIGNSRDTSFERLVRTLTDGAGVDIVLNSLAGDKLQASVHCLGRFGRLLEIGKFDMANRSSLPMHNMLKGVSYESIVLDQLWSAPDTTQQVAELHRLVSEGIASGEVTPLPFTAFSGARVQDAFEYLVPGTHIGKVIIQLRPCDAREAAASNTWAPKGAAAAPPPALATGDDMLGDIGVSTSLPIKPGSVYILTGGLGGFGQALAMYLAQHGATRLVLTSRSGVRHGIQRRLLSQLEAMGVLVVISSLDVSVTQQARDLFKLAQRMGPLGGVFHLAMVLSDRLFPNMTGEAWEAVLKPKIRGAANLDMLSKGVPGLDLFVVFSSILTAIGNPGQSAYGYANSCMEAMCQERRAAGLPAVSIQWPILAHLGYAANNEGLFRAFTALMDKHAPLPVDDALHHLGPLLAAQEEHCVLQLFAVPDKGLGASKAASGKTLVQAALDILGLSSTAAGLHTPLVELGLDSMQAVNMRGTIQSALNVSYPLSEVPKLTLAKLAELDRKVRPAADASLEEAAGDAKMGDAEVEDSAKEDSAKGSFGDPPASPALSSAGGDTEPVAAPPAAPAVPEAPRALHLTNGSVPHHPDGMSSARSEERRVEKAAVAKMGNSALAKPHLKRSPSLMSRMASKWLCGGQSPQVLEDNFVPAKPAREVAPLEDPPAHHAWLGPGAPSRPLPHMGACVLAASMVCPEERISSEQLLQHVMARSQDALGRGGAAKMRAQLQGLLQYVKFKERPYTQADQWSDIEAMRDAVTAALEAAACQRSEIDLIIFTGCEKGMLEPAQAAMCGMAFGMPNANNFDIGEGCAAYIRAVEIASVLIACGKVGKVLVVSAIAGVDSNDGGVMASMDDLAHKFAGLMVTVCATATILGPATSAQDDMQLAVHRKADNNLAAVGVYTTHSWGPRFVYIPEKDQDWSFGGYNTAKVMEKLTNRPGTAFGLSQFMFKEAARMTKELIKERGQAELASWQLAITHSVALTPWEKIFRDAMPSFDCKNLHFNVFQHLGNCGENSLPVSIVQAVQQGRINPGMRVGFVLPTAGVTTIIGGLNVAHVDADGCFKRVLPARPGRARAVVEAVSLLPGKH